MAYKTSFSLFSLMRTFIDGVSIVRLLLVTLVPFVISFSVAATSLKFLIYPLSTIKGFLYAYCASVLLNSFIGYGWLIKLLLLFSNSISILFLILIWVRILDGSIKMIDIFTSVSAVCIVCFIDYYIVIPNAASLFIH